IPPSVPYISLNVFTPPLPTPSYSLPLTHLTPSSNSKTEEPPNSAPVRTTSESKVLSLTIWDRDGTEVR
ncbi:hypothetical protein PoB_004908600, partial [Plakobranchus ocellatus]